MITDEVSIENYMLVDIDPSFSSQITSWILAVEQYMNKVTDRQLIADTSADEYEYDGTGKDSIMVDDFVEITKVEDEDEDITADCFFYPANDNPKWRIASDNRSFSRGHQNIVVTGKRGFATQADIDTKYLDLKFAATVLVAGIINYGYAGTVGDKEIVNESIGQYSVSYEKGSQQQKDFDNIKSTLSQYRRIR